VAAAHGHHLAPFAKVLLAFNDLHHHNKAAAHAKLEGLHAQFTNNPLFTRELAQLEKPAAGPEQ
ncbi:MAG TPA: hypothetical protein VFY05_14020, partial [Candidatus Angelobacter sp.]|nr:hypothetical protein [Candidatus Angelobacter sp.]